jgi:hypothetical protein
MRRRWKRYFGLCLDIAKSRGWSQTRLGRQFGVPASRLTKWANGEEAPERKTAFRVGEDLRRCCIPSSGLISLYALGRYIDVARLLSEIVCEDSFKERTAVAVRMYCRIPSALTWVNDVADGRPFGGKSTANPSLVIDAGIRLDFIPANALVAAWQRVLDRRAGFQRLPVVDVVDKKARVIVQRPRFLGVLQNRAWMALESAIATAERFSQIPDYQAAVMRPDGRKIRKPEADMWAVDFNELQERLWYHLREWAVCTDAPECNASELPLNPVALSMSVLQLLRKPAAVMLMDDDVETPPGSASGES